MRPAEQIRDIRDWLSFGFSFAALVWAWLKHLGNKKAAENAANGVLLTYHDIARELIEGRRSGKGRVKIDEKFVERFLKKGVTKTIEGRKYHVGM